MKPVGKLHHLDAGEKRRQRMPRQVYSTGSAELDRLLPDHGWPRAGLVEVCVDDEYTQAVDLLLPLLAGLGSQPRSIALVTPSYTARQRLLTASGVEGSRMLQVNPHPGRSGLWTMESLLRSGSSSVVMAWSECATELMARRLRKAGTTGRSLGFLFRSSRHADEASGADVRLRVERSDAGLAVYLLDRSGLTLAGTLCR